MEIKETEQKDIKDVVLIISQAKHYFRENGIPQWQGDYPNEMDILKDIENYGAYCIKNDHEVVGYSFVAQYKDPNYSYIEGQWLNEEPYVVIHRTCIKDTMKGKNLASEFVVLAKTICEKNQIHNIRVDTHEKNISMQKMLEKNGFIKTGIIYVEDGSPRFAYQLVL